ncbi:hypothetical protein [Paracoccus albus]|uniref:hypothetical protein n=1 Tax=Paracoccus albus TaxID=3017784 RepID=UPI0022F05200|nr:hypothetical protein [Paracoccus albus]WBU61864.1 hypothetical protein PAF20_08260 [Paracoccus albus]
MGYSEYDFLEGYIRFLVSQNLVHANYSDLLIDLEHREMVPIFIAPLSRRGNILKDFISKSEDDLVKAGILQPSRYRAAQEAFVEMAEMSLFPRFDRITKISRALRSNLRHPASEDSDPLKLIIEQPVAED